MKEALIAIALTLVLAGCSTTPPPPTDEAAAEPPVVDTRLAGYGLATDASKTSIDLDLVLPGGPGKDGIPAIDEPAFVSIAEAEENDEVLGVFVEVDGVKRWYPYTVLVWHEIVNDSVGDTHFAVTFCPLCGSAIIFDRTIDGVANRLGVSGMLYESNLLMYDNETESLWSQSRGEAVLGTHTGRTLTRLPLQLLTFGELKELHSDTTVLSRDTGFRRNYNVYPYGDYETDDRLIFPVQVKSDQYPLKEIMYIVPVAGQSIAIPWAALPQGAHEITLGDETLQLTRTGSEVTVTWHGDVIPGYYEMWFSWLTQHFETGLTWNPASGEIAPVRGGV